VKVLQWKFREKNEIKEFYFPLDFSIDAFEITGKKTKLCSSLNSPGRNFVVLILRLIKNSKQQ